jgi:hypothetical protein
LAAFTWTGKRCPSEEAKVPSPPQTGSREVVVVVHDVVDGGGERLVAQVPGRGAGHLVV